MNPLTQVKNTQKITAREAALGISDAGSWHAKYKDSAYIYAGNFAFDLTEGDILAIFAQYGEIVDLNLVRDKGTGKSRGFAFLAYEDQRSTVLAVDNLNGANVVGRTIKVDHVANYKRKAEEDEEEEQRKREERGVCRAFQRGECNRGASCKFSHDEMRSANTGWGSKDDATRWTHDKFDRTSQQAHRNRDEDGNNRRDSGSRLKERQGAEFSDGSRRERGSRLQERDGSDRILSFESEQGHSSMIGRKGRDENRTGRGSEERDHRHRDRDDRKDQRNHRTERGSEERDHQRRDRDDRKDQRSHRYKGGDDTVHHPRGDDAQQRRSDDEEFERRRKSRKLDSGCHNDDEYNSVHRRSHSETEKRDSRDGKHSKVDRR